MKMKGVYKGVRVYILNENEKYFYTTCACHTQFEFDIKKHRKTVSYANQMQKYILYTLSQQTRQNVLKQLVKQ